MKYKTIIEVICDAQDKDEATNLAGEYLKGDIDFGVTMKARTYRLVTHTVKRLVAVVAFAVILSATLFINVANFTCNNNTGAGAIAFRNIYTVTPPLNTKRRAGFRTKWEQKKNEAIMGFLKNDK